MSASTATKPEDDIPIDETTADYEESNQEDYDASTVQSYLISNYRDALKRGDKSAAKSCLLTARFFSSNDPVVSNEIYLMAKTDNDIAEAAKCFANMFNDLLLNGEQHTAYDELVVGVIEQIREETRWVLSELKSKYLRVKSITPQVPASIMSRNPSVSGSPSKSPRARMSSDDIKRSFDSFLRLETQLLSSSRGVFYTQLYENLPEATQRSIIDYSIEHCDNTFERARLRMLALAIFGDNAKEEGTKLIKELIDQSDNQPKTGETVDLYIKHPRTSMARRYARCLLVFDAIPNVLELNSHLNSAINYSELQSKIFQFYSDYCLEAAASENDPEQMHEGVKRLIAGRILGHEHVSSSEDSSEEHIIHTIKLMNQKFFNSILDKTIKDSFETLNTLIYNRAKLEESLEQILKAIESILGQLRSLKSSSLPQKSIGRVKKAQTQSSPILTGFDESANKLVIEYAFYTVILVMMTNLSGYLKSTKSRVLLNVKYQLIEKQQSAKTGQKAIKIKTDKSEESSQESLESPRKKLRTEELDISSEKIIQKTNNPLNSEQSRRMDKEVICKLQSAKKCFDFLSKENDEFKYLWSQFLSTSNLNATSWYNRILVDFHIISADYESAKTTIQEYFSTQEKDVDRLKNTISHTARDIRKLIQLLSCQIELADKNAVLDILEELITEMQQSNLFNESDSNDLAVNNIQEYSVKLDTILNNSSSENLCFLFFDSFSIMRYIIGIITEQMKSYVFGAKAVSDTAIGHCIVLSQFDWPKGIELYEECIAWIRSTKPKSTTPQCLSEATKFTYAEFFDYIKSPLIIEEFMSMLLSGYTLDINPSSSAAPTRATSGTRSKAITTRGVNKSFKEDLKVFLVTQMRMSNYYPTQGLISRFLKNSLIPFLNKN